MIPSEWVVCERRPRWSAALRMLTRQQAAKPTRNPRVYEVRILDEVEAKCARNPGSIRLVEVTPTNFGELLTWLAKLNYSGQSALIVALLDFSSTLNSHSAGARQHDRHSAIDALREAGAADVIESPRQLPSVLGLGTRHFDRSRPLVFAGTNNQSIADMAWASLPWQDS